MKAPRTDREAVVLAAIRWSRNMLSEVLGNHGGAIDPKIRDIVSRAIEALSEIV